MKFSKRKTRHAVTDFHPKSLSNTGDPTDYKNQKKAAMLVLHDRSFHFQNAFLLLSLSEKECTF